MQMTFIWAPRYERARVTFISTTAVQQTPQETPSETPHPLRRAVVPKDNGENLILQ